MVEPQLNKPLNLLIEEKINPSTYLIVATSVSNVTGYELPIEEIRKAVVELVLQIENKEKLLNDLFK